MCNDRYTPLPYHTEWFHCPENLLCSACSSLPPLKPLAITDFFTVSIVLHFPECHIIGIIICVVFSDLFSLSDANLRFLHAFSWLDNSFFLVLGNIPLSEYTTICLSIHLLKTPIEGANNSTYLIGLFWGLKNIINVTYLAECLIYECYFYRVQISVIPKL